MGLVPTVRVTARFQELVAKEAAGVSIESVFDPLADDVVLAVGAVQVDLVQDASAVASPGGDLCERAYRVQALCPARRARSGRGWPPAARPAGSRRGRQRGEVQGLGVGLDLPCWTAAVGVRAAPEPGHVGIEVVTIRAISASLTGIWS